MEIPKNLREVVQYVNPRAILLLDTNTILNNPHLAQYRIAAPGTFLSVIPDVVGGEMMSLRLGDSDSKTRRKAASALENTWEVYMSGDPASGIKLLNGSWLMTVTSVRAPGSAEDDLVRKQFGPVDAALLRLTGACAEDVPDILSILVTGDRDLKRFAKLGGLCACSLSDLRRPEVLSKMLGSEAIED